MTAFVDVTVVAPRVGTAAAHQTVLVDGERIVRVGPTTEVGVPAGARIVAAAAAAALGRPDDGAVAGARADLVLLDRDPLASVENLAHPAGVMVRGRWSTRADLDALLAAHRTSAAAPE